MAAKSRERPATYEDVLKAPEHMVAEVIEGDMYLSPRPRPRHLVAAGTLLEELGPPFRRGKGGPGGWIILMEPELHLGREPAIVVPDLAGWKREHLPLLDDTQPYFTLAPDWICEVISPSTGRLDRIKKLPLYAREGVHHAWIVEPAQRSLEVFRNESGFKLISTHEADDKVRAEPFDAIQLDLSLLWADVKPSEP